MTVTLNTLNHLLSDILRMTYDANRLMIPLLRRKSFTTTTRPSEGQNKGEVAADAKKIVETTDHKNCNLYMYASVDGVLEYDKKLYHLELTTTLTSVVDFSSINFLGLK